MSERALSKVCKTLAGGSKVPWQERNKALKELDGLLSSFSPSQLKAHSTELVDALRPNLASLRSELVRAAAATLASLCREAGQSARRVARRLLPTLVEVASSTNSVIRRHALKAAPSVLQSVHSPALLDDILRHLASTKSKLGREATTEFLRQVLAFWPIGDKYSAYAEPLEEAVRVSLRAADQSVRATGSRLFWLYCGHFPQRRAAFMASLDARLQRVVERAGKTVEDEAQEYRAATKIAALARARIVRKRTRDSITLSKVLMLGERVRLRGRRSATGSVRFHGELSGKTGPWIGVVLDKPVRSGGDGTHDGECLMDCDPGCAVFVRVVDVERLTPEDEAKAKAKGGSTTPRREAAADRAGSPTLPGVDDGNEDGDEEDEDDLFAAGKLTASPLVLLEALRAGPPAGLDGGGDGAGDDAPTPKAGSPATSPTAAAAAAAAKASPASGAAAAAEAAASPSGDEAALAAGMAGVSLRPPAPRHQRHLSVPEANERDLLVLEHKLHMKACAELLDQEMNLVASTASDTYVEDVLRLMEKFVEHSQLVRSKFADFRRRTRNQEVLEDEFLSEMDNFQ